MFPVFSLVLDKDVSAKIALTYPELYKELSKGRSLSFKTFFMWVLISIYQGKYFKIFLLLFIDFTLTTVFKTVISDFGNKAYFQLPAEWSSDYHSSL